jgi:hypothetical protein
MPFTRTCSHINIRVYDRIRCLMSHTYVYESRCVCFWDSAFPAFPTFPVMHRAHIEAFGKLFPDDFRNQARQATSYMQHKTLSVLVSVFGSRLRVWVSGARSPYTVYPVPNPQCPIPNTQYTMPNTLYPIPYAQYTMPRTIKTLDRVPYTLYPILCVLHPMPYNLYHTPCTLYPIP